MGKHILYDWFYGDQLHSLPRVIVGDTRNYAET